ncbi:MAG: 1,4-alpha-glucan branching protein GlgB [Pseudomonadales bacterium]|nr:1,4-alpha-glucan branching protein GlgB [Pseudomonadales bacterium]HJN51428.1 1,4-alpha-glucan branching protein GlgB [Pseudomonadales bacterium]
MNRLAVRAFVPWAQTVEVLDGKSGVKVGVLDQVHDEGLFEGILKRRRTRFAYLLRIFDGSQTVEVADPYQFQSVLTDDQCHLFSEGTSERAYEWLGAHPKEIDGVEGTIFVVWAPNASRVSVVGDFNRWDGRCHVMRNHPGSGLWEIFLPHVLRGALYKFEICTAEGTLLPLKADPYAFAMHQPADTVSVVWDKGGYHWHDQEWMEQRRQDYLGLPMSIYEVHLASWKRVPDEGNRYLSYHELADQLIPYVKELGFTHIQIMPISEYPFDGSWGYQPIGLFAPTRRFGTPADFKYFVDRCHQADIGLLLDWVPGHFPTDEHGLGRFDGSYLYEHEDPRRGFHPDWNTLVYNYERREVVTYLLSNAHYWCDQYHVDGLRMDAVASMLYLDYSRKDGDWSPNMHGGRENLAAVDLLRLINERIHAAHPGVIMIAEESTAWPGVSHPTYSGGLGFGFKWNLGWMHDTLDYMGRESIHRKYHHSLLTFGLLYAFSENFILPISHDEVVYGKGSLLSKMSGDEKQRFATLRAYLAFMWTQPGKKLLFMGCEFAQLREWNHDDSLDWQLLEEPMHAGVQQLLKDLNHLYRCTPALHQLDCESAGFTWLIPDDSDNSVIAYLRHGGSHPPAIVVSNLTPMERQQYRIGVPKAGFYNEILNTDSEFYGGSNLGNMGGVTSDDCAAHSYEDSISITLPPLTTLIFQMHHHG